MFSNKRGTLVIYPKGNIFMIMRLVPSVGANRTATPPQSKSQHHHHHHSIIITHSHNHNNNARPITGHVHTLNIWSCILLYVPHLSQYLTLLSLQASSSTNHCNSQSYSHQTKPLSISHTISAK